MRCVGVDVWVLGCVCVRVCYKRLLGFKSTTEDPNTGAKDMMDSYNGILY